MFIIHFMISEQEPILRVIIVYGGHSSTNRMLVSVSILILFYDLLILSLFINSNPTNMSYSDRSDYIPIITQEPLFIQTLEISVGCNITFIVPL